MIIYCFDVDMIFTGIHAVGDKPGWDRITLLMLHDYIPRYTEYSHATEFLARKYLLITTRTRSLRQGNVFTPVSHSVHGGVHPPGHNLDRYPPEADHP